MKITSYKCSGEDNVCVRRAAENDVYMNYVTDHHPLNVYLCSVPRVGCLELRREARRLERKLPKEKTLVGNGGGTTGPKCL